MPIISLVIFFLTALFFMVMVQVHLFEIAFTKLGLTPETTMLLVIGTLVGSGINLPLFELRTKQSGHLVLSPERKLIWELFQPAKEGKTIVAVNVGGCIIPVGLCFYFISLQLLEPISLLIALSAITLLSYQSSRIIPNVGVGMPLFIAPLCAALLALVLAPEHPAQLAYVSGVLGVLIGADVLRINEIGGLNAPIASIGGAGTFDGIFLTGIIAVLLA
ncbi:MAG: DUF1614 domain-containing protein [Methylococcaceae bacterium]|nr:DUF1614 domain-containing protein [Methylococcaceae bacterium]MDD1609562.1 DUF1614 domain-containing protein [Methylococcaceae bacterium]MDD1615876.1 DUF1614 domain-containing protein [Methylococcaceae bacterium]OYV19176.1 MAG: hypothetical protein CG439_986 [Methylococcaceae bacterium NSP1-2]